MGQLDIDVVFKGGTAAMSASVPYPVVGPLNDFLDRTRPYLALSFSQWPAAN